MSTETNQWIKAEENFHKWIEAPASYERNKDSEIRKSIHLYFRKKSKDRFTQFPRQVFRSRSVDDFLQLERVKETEPHYPVLSEEETDYFDRIDFSKESASEINKKILSRFWNGDKQVIKKFYEEEFNKVALLIIRNSGTTDDARDIFQDSLMILLDKYKWGKLDLNCSPGTYIYSISRNLWYTHLRKLKKENEFIELEQYRIIDISTDYYEEQPENYDSVYNAIEKLGDPCRQILELFYFEKCSWETIAASLGYASAASARNQKYKCLEKIREQL